MQSPTEAAANGDQDHWICGQGEHKVKLNLNKFYKAGLNSRTSSAAQQDDPSTLHSCVNHRRKRLQFEQKGPYVYRLHTVCEYEPKCRALDLLFDEPTTVVEIRFQNYYVAYLTVMAKFSHCRDWETLVEKKQLMPYPHYETNARSYFELLAPNVTNSSSVTSTITWTDITEIRLIMQQPSPNWKEFLIEDLSLYAEREKISDDNVYLLSLLKRTEDALKMRVKMERKASSIIPLHIGTTGYEIDKLPKF